ncbi:protein let-653-like [Anabas testudineus]|uniref:protein let-653-like n=1 Tax=Anabas testudineus TaxID=64144 RepID=UPI000E45FEF8|nr:protein let-653-like [Anabas testudineus]
MGDPHNFTSTTAKPTTTTTSVKSSTLTTRSTFIPPTTTRTTASVSFSSSSGRVTQLSSSTKTTKQLQTGSSCSSGVLLYVFVTLVIISIASLVAVLILRRRRDRKPKEHPQETAYDNVTEVSPTYEEIRETDRQSTSPPVEGSTADTKPNGVETTNRYSLATAPPACAQSPPEDSNSRILIVSVVDFPSSAAASLHSAPCGNTDNVVYSAPWEEAGSANHAEQASDSLYSNVAVQKE